MDRRRLVPAWRAFCIAAGLAVLQATCAGADPAASLQALGRSLAWLEAHPPADPRTARLGDLCLDAWAWYLFAALHPDPDVRRHAGAELDRRLRTLPPPSERTEVSLSYWATLMRLMQRRGIDTTSHAAAFSGPESATVMRTAAPTTRWWTAELFRRSGVPMTPDFSGTFIATGAASSADYTPTRREAYRIFHELAPAADLGLEPLTQLTPAQMAFARRVVPGLLAVSQAEADTDAVAEVLVSAALLGERDTPLYRDGIAWLLAQQRPDGTYMSARDRMRPATADNFRHVVAVGSLAVFTSLAGAAGDAALDPHP
jgi:hypothetical protein